MTTAKTKPRAGMRLSVAEFMDLPDADDKRKMELDDGELYIMPRPREMHQFVQYWLRWRFENYLDGFAEPPARLWHDGVVILSHDARQIVVPDLVVILREREHIIVDGYVVGVPDIVVEILSSDRARDLVRKRQLYAAAGVPEYWLFDLRPDTVAQLELNNGAYTQRALLTADDTLTTPLLPGLAIPLSAIFRHRRRPPRSD